MACPPHPQVFQGNKTMTWYVKFWLGRRWYYLEKSRCQKYCRTGICPFCILLTIPNTFVIQRLMSVIWEGSYAPNLCFLPILIWEFSSIFTFASDILGMYAAQSLFKKTTNKQKKTPWFQRNLHRRCSRIVYQRGKKQLYGAF